MLSRGWTWRSGPAVVCKKKAHCLSWFGKSYLHGAGIKARPVEKHATAKSMGILHGQSHASIQHHLCHVDVALWDANDPVDQGQVLYAQG